MAQYPGYPQHGGQGGARKEFYIVTEMGKKDKVLDIRGEKSAAGTPVIIYKKSSSKKANQLWYVDQNGHVKSALNDMVFHNNDKGQTLKMEMPSNDPRAQWRIDGNKIVNGANECLDVRGAKDDDNTEVCAYDYKKKTQPTLAYHVRLNQEHVQAVDNYSANHNEVLIDQPISELLTVRLVLAACLQYVSVIIASLLNAC